MQYNEYIYINIIAISSRNVAIKRRVTRSSFIRLRIININIIPFDTRNQRYLNIIKNKYNIVINYINNSLMQKVRIFILNNIYA